MVIRPLLLRPATPPSLRAAQPKSNMFQQWVAHTQGRSEHLSQMPVVQCLILLGVVLALGIVVVPADDALGAVLGDADADVGVLGVELVQPGPPLFHLAAVPAEVVVVALYIGNVMHGAVNRGVGDVGNGGETGGIQLTHPASAGRGGCPPAPGRCRRSGSRWTGPRT